MSDTETTLMQVKSLGKLYARRPADTRKRMTRMARNAFLNIGNASVGSLKVSEFWAVENVSFELKRGEALGIIGLNGSGKTTLLRMLAGQLMPDAGEIVIRGTSAAMIDLQAGLRGSASGRENIYLRAAALGFRRSETEGRVQEIIDFSELEHAIDAPLSTYSSGMKMRLAFSVMAMVAPDLLLIDEVLAVGDFRFRQKSLARMREMRSRSAFVFVSHSMGDVAKFCDRVIVMHKGRVFFEGAPEEALEIYEKLDSNTPTRDAGAQMINAMGPVFENPKAISEVEHYWCDAHGDVVESIGFNEPLRLRLKFRSHIGFRSLIIGVPIWALNTHYITGLSTQITSDSFDVRAGDRVDFLLEVVPGFLNPGELKSMLTILDGPEFLFRKPNPDIAVRKARHPTWGSITIPHKWVRLDTPENHVGVTRLVPGTR
ncbi:polysaccharide ABC transporter ATP-binding protein [Hyphomonas sp.]|uniref:ABC transporter ATP-binding protein n=1 Tax=Hyphomonas sp. TaxID=87 RepID=UPI003D26A5CF